MLERLLAWGAARHAQDPERDAAPDASAALPAPSPERADAPAPPPPDPERPARRGLLPFHGAGEARGPSAAG